MTEDRELFDKPMNSEQRILFGGNKKLSGSLRRRRFEMVMIEM